MRPGDRLVCTFVENRKAGSQFSRWPLHVTIVPWFRLDDPSTQIALGLERALQRIPPFEVTADGEARFGPRSRSVRLIQQPTPFTDVEAKVRGYLRHKRAWLVDETTKRHYDFRPHVTMQKTSTLQAGHSFWCDHLYIVEQKGDYKEVMSEVRLGKTTA